VKVKPFSSAKAHFNPRAPVGRDIMGAIIGVALIPHFNPRAPVGRDRF